MKVTMGQFSSTIQTIYYNIIDANSLLYELQQYFQSQILNNDEFMPDEASKILKIRIDQKYNDLIVKCREIGLEINGYLTSYKRDFQSIVGYNELIDLSLKSALLASKIEKSKKIESLKAQLVNIRPGTRADGAYGIATTMNNLASQIDDIEIKLDRIQKVERFEAKWAGIFSSITNKIKNLTVDAGMLATVDAGNYSFSENNTTTNSPNVAGFASAVGGTAYGAYTGGKTNQPGTGNGSINPGDTVITPGEGQNITPPPKDVVPGEKFYAEYTTQPGDTFESISKKYYGDESQAKFIADYNNMNVGDAIEPGIIIKVPWSNENQGPVVPPVVDEPVVPPVEEPIIIIPPAENEIIFGDPITDPNGLTPNQTIIPPIQQPDSGNINVVPTANPESNVVPPTGNEINF